MCKEKSSWNRVEVRELTGGCWEESDASSAVGPGEIMIFESVVYEKSKQGQEGDYPRIHEPRMHVDSVRCLARACKDPTVVDSPRQIRIYTGGFNSKRRVKA